MREKKGYKIKPNGKNDTGRPTKLTPELLERLEKLINVRGWEILTDEEVCDELEIEEDTKKNWIDSEFQDEDKKKFFGLIKKARRRAKVGLAERIKTGENGWQGSAWIAERKFDDLRLTQKFETKNETNLNLSLKPEAQKAIDAMLSD